jgi:hypothetical protein
MLDAELFFCLILHVTENTLVINGNRARYSNVSSASALKSLVTQHERQTWQAGCDSFTLTA